MVTVCVLAWLCACVCVPLTGVSFECSCERERERERAIAQHILPLTSSSTPDRHGKHVWTLLALHPSPPPGEFPSASSLGELSADPYRLADKANHKGHERVNQSVCVCVCTFTVPTNE